MQALKLGVTHNDKYIQNITLTIVDVLYTINIEE